MVNIVYLHSFCVAVPCAVSVKTSPVINMVFKGGNVEKNEQEGKEIAWVSSQIRATIKSH